MTISDFAAMAPAVAAFGALFFAWRTIEHSKKEARKWKTIESCERYDTDPILDAALRTLRSAKLDKSLAKTPEKFKPDIVTVMNYLDGIAIGISQGLLVEAIVKDQIRSVFMAH